MTFKPEAIIWTLEGVVAEGDKKPRISKEMLGLLSSYRDLAIPMALIITEDGPAADIFLDLKLSSIFKSILAAPDFDETKIDSAATQAFLAARKVLDTVPRNTVAVVPTTRHVRYAHNAGLAVLGYAGSSLNAPEDVPYVRSVMLERTSAFNAVSTLQEIPSAIAHHRPFREYEWQKIGLHHDKI